jgi:hypothetical protein
VEGALLALHLGAQLPHPLAQQVDQHVEAAAVRHAHLDAPHAVLRAALDKRDQARHQRLAALQPEPAGAPAGE